MCVLSSSTLLPYKLFQVFLITSLPSFILNRNFCKSPKKSFFPKRIFTHWCFLTQNLRNAHSSSKTTHPKDPTLEVCSSLINSPNQNFTPKTPIPTSFNYDAPGDHGIIGFADFTLFPKRVDLLIIKEKKISLLKRPILLTWTFDSGKSAAVEPSLAIHASDSFLVTGPKIPFFLFIVNDGGIERLSQTDWVLKEN